VTMATTKASEDSMEKVLIQGVELTLMPPVEGDDTWIDYDALELQLEAAWLRVSDREPPLNPRLIGEPGLGKTTLARAVARTLGRGVYIFQCTMDTRPEDLLITPVLAADRRVEYRASSLVSAMIRGGVLILDEGNRMPERSWASLAALLDGRRYIESTIASIRVYELPGYIQSRLKPKIELATPSWEIKEEIVRLKCSGVDGQLLADVFAELKRRATGSNRDSIRDVLSFAQYAKNLHERRHPTPLQKAVEQILAPIQP
jgi:MoxR-like ATPase